MLESLITKPPAGAGPVREAVPVEEAPPANVAGETVKAEIEGGCIARLAETDAPSLAEMAAIT